MTCAFLFPSSRTLVRNNTPALQNYLKIAPGHGPENYSFRQGNQRCYVEPLVAQPTSSFSFQTFIQIIMFLIHEYNL